jgi:arginase
MDLHLFSWPYDSGVRDVRMGRGPGHLLDRGLAEHLELAGHSVQVDVVEVPVPPLTPEPKIAQELNRSLAAALAEARRQGRFPVVLAGSCFSALGTVTGLRGSRSGFSRGESSRTGVVWFDSHGDFNTPETTESGFLDGMALAALTGRCWAQLTAGIPGFIPVDPAHVCLVAARDVDPLEGEHLASAGVRRVLVEEVNEDLEAAVTTLAGRVDELYLHLDLDALDPSEGRANALAAPDGLSLEATCQALRLIAGKAAVGAVALTAYDPELDGEGRVHRAAFALLDEVLEGVGSSSF